MLFPFFLLLLKRSWGFRASYSNSVGTTFSQYHVVQRKRTRIRATIPEKEVENRVVHLPDMKAYAEGYKTVFEEVPFRICTTSEGAIPSDLQGSYYRAGPAMFSAGSIVPPKTSIIQPKNLPVPDGQDPERMVRHPFEGDGAVLAISFVSENDDDQGQPTNQALFRYRYVRTNALINERKKGQKCYNAMESTRELGSDCALGFGNDWHLPFYRHHFQPGLNKNRKNTSNTRAVFWGKRLLTLWEGGLPYKLDALALSTEGRSLLGGAIPGEEEPFGSKMVIDSKRNRALFYGIRQDAKQSELTLYEFGPDFRLVDGGRTTISLPGFCIFNDFAATENYALFVQPPIAMNGMQFMFNKEPGKVTSLVKDSAALLCLIPRAGTSKRPQTLTLPIDDISDASIHFINAYEDGEEKIVMDIIRTKGAPPGKDLPRWPWADTMEKYRTAAGTRSLWRYTANTVTGTVTKECLARCNPAFGSVNPTVSTQRHRFIYTNVGIDSEKACPPQGVARYDSNTKTMEQWMPAEYEFCGEPMFAPSGSEESSGYVLTILLNGQRQESELIVLNAQSLAAGPIARIPLGMVVPHGLFGCFVPHNNDNNNDDIGVVSSETIARRAKLADKMESRGNMWNEIKSDFSGLGLRLDDIDEYFPGLFG